MFLPRQTLDSTTASVCASLAKATETASTGAQYCSMFLSNHEAAPSLWEVWESALDCCKSLWIGQAQLITYTFSRTRQKTVEKQSNAASKILRWDAMLKGLTTQVLFDVNLIQLLHNDSFDSQDLSANQQLSACTVTRPLAIYRSHICDSSNDSLIVLSVFQLNCWFAPLWHLNLSLEKTTPRTPPKITEGRRTHALARRTTSIFINIKKKHARVHRLKGERELCPKMSKGRMLEGFGTGTSSINFDLQSRMVRCPVKRVWNDHAIVPCKVHSAVPAIQAFFINSSLSVSACRYTRTSPKSLPLLHEFSIVMKCHVVISL